MEQGEKPDVGDAMVRPGGARVVLVRPRGAANLGAVARALKNFGLRRLTLVDSRIGSWVDAHRMAVHSEDVLAAAVQCATLEEALADAHWVVGTTNRPLPGQTLLTPREVAAQSAQRGAPVLVFGGEESGLANLELRRCHALSTIPVAPEQPSLNLAQAVLVYAAELFVAAIASGTGIPAAARPEPAAIASGALMQHLEQALRDALSSSDWAAKCRPNDAIGQLMQPFYRAALLESEARAWLVALHRIVRRGG